METTVKIKKKKKEIEVLPKTFPQLFSVKWFLTQLLIWRGIQAVLHLAQHSRPRAGCIINKGQGNVCGNELGFFLRINICFDCWLIGKDPDAGRDWGQEEKVTTEDRMAGWHHQLDGHEFQWTLGVGDGQRGLMCCHSWGHKESDTTEWLN